MSGRGATDAASGAEESSLLAAAAAALVDWYRDHARDLPWRRTDDPYRILVSEVMLQQTRVEAVRGRYEEFLTRFPDLEALAAAEEDEVLAAWSGLGYYRRARNLHRLARQVVHHGNGRLPGDRQGLRELPGIGEYTSAAVASIAFGAPELTVDGNVARVLARLLALEDDARRPAVRRRLEELMAGPFRTHPPADLNQALMELGARVCLPASPRCTLCPCARLCRACRLGIQETLPPSRKSEVRDVEEAAAVIERQGRYLLLRGQRPGVLQRMWEFPTLDSRLCPDATVAESDAGGEPLEPELRRHLTQLGIDVHGRGERLGAIRHGITTRRIRCHVYRLRLHRPPTPDPSPSPATSSGPADAGWFAPGEARDLPIAASTQRILDLLTEPRLPV